MKRSVVKKIDSMLNNKLSHKDNTEKAKIKKN